MGLFDKLAIKKYGRIADKVIALEETMKGLSDDDLRAKTDYFRELLRSGKTLDDIKVEAFAVEELLVNSHTKYKSLDLSLFTLVMLPK